MHAQFKDRNDDITSLLIMRLSFTFQTISLEFNKFKHN